MVVVVVVVIRRTKVPVLSEQMVVALPMVSQARSMRTRLFSLSKRVVANARASVTARGSPSGTATTMMVMATMRMSMNADAFSAAGRRSPDRSATNRNSRTKNRRPAAVAPSLAMARARRSSFFCRGVSSTSVRTDIIILPKLLLTPTEVHKNVPMPDDPVRLSILIR